MRPGGWNIQRIRSAQIYWISRNTAETQLCSTKKEPRTKKPHIWHTPSWCWTNQMCVRNTLKQQSPDKELNTWFQMFRRFAVWCVCAFDFNNFFAERLVYVCVCTDGLRFYLHVAWQSAHAYDAKPSAATQNHKHSARMHWCSTA